MKPELIAVAQSCLDATHDGNRSFPEIVAMLIASGFEGYLVDYRSNKQSTYLTDGDTAVLDMPSSHRTIAAMFDAAQVEAAVRWAQSGASDYSYDGFSAQVKAAGCAGYLVSFPGRRVVYFGRSGETHIEYMPQ